jgi:hypothetical protein
VARDVVEQLDELAHSWPAAVPRDQPPQLAQVEELELLGALDGAAQLVGRHDGGQVDQGPRDRRRRDAVELSDLVGGEVAAPDPHRRRRLASCGGGNGDLPPRAAVGSQAPRRGGAAMAQHGAITAGEHDRPALAEDRELRPADGVDPVVLVVQ